MVCTLALANAGNLSTGRFVNISDHGSLVALIDIEGHNVNGGLHLFVLLINSSLAQCVRCFCCLLKL